MPPAGETEIPPARATTAASAFIALGSNIDAERNLPAAVGRLAATPGLRLTALSGVYRTPPWGVEDQPSFLNAAAAAETTLSPLELLDALQAIENRLGRTREVRFGPRTIDLDLLLYAEQVIDSERLTVPHPRLHERGFVLTPLCDLAPELIHPVLNRAMADLLARVDVDGIERTELELPTA